LTGVEEDGGGATTALNETPAGVLATLTDERTGLHLLKAKNYTIQLLNM